MGGKGKHPDSGGFIYYGPSPSHRVLTLKKRDYDTDDSNCPLSFSLFLSRSLLHPHPLLSTSFYSAPSAGIDNKEEKKEQSLPAEIEKCDLKKRSESKLNRLT